MGQYKFVLLDDDGDLSDDKTDSITLRGIGTAGSSTSVETVSMALKGQPVDCLQMSFHTQGPLTTGSSDSITTNQTVSSNSMMMATINGNAWSIGAIVGTVSGTVDQYQTPALTIPEAATVFDCYINNGTHIPLSDIPSESIDKQLISPNYNPFGVATNALGIYMIDCEGKGFNIKDSRTLGTLVLLNVGGNLYIEHNINWEPAVANYPALMVQGEVEMKWLANQSLSEGDQSVNYNPAGSPYLGVVDSDTNDLYPGVIKGLVYISGNLRSNEICNLEGALIVGGASNVTNELTITYDPAISSNPPPGFSDGSIVQIVPGSWQRAAN